MNRYCLVVGLIVGAHGASIDVLQVDTATDNAVYNGAAGDAEAFTWRYESQTLAGAIKPADWGTGGWASAAKCDTGTSQSPINIVSADLVTETTDPGALVGTLWDTDMEGYLVNNGRVLRFSHLGMARPTVTGGPAGTKVYAFSHIDFHFGEMDNEGSEHTMDGTQYPMEMQLVFYDGSFMSAQDAEVSTDADALLTIGNFFTVDTSDNANLKPIVDILPDIVNAVTMGRKKREAVKARQSAATFPLLIDDNPGDNAAPTTNNIKALTLKLSDLIGATEIGSYYYYDGSMTQPNCNENTKWVINKDMLKISSTQLTAFRTLVTHDVATSQDKVAGNFRPTQAVGSRKVYKRIAPFSVDETQLKIIGGTLAGIPTFFLVNQFLNQPETAKALRENPVATFVQSNLDNLFNGGQDVVQQRSSDEAGQYAGQYQQPVYQPQQYQQYVPQAAPAPQ